METRPSFISFSFGEQEHRLARFMGGPEAKKTPEPPSDVPKDTKEAGEAPVNSPDTVAAKGTEVRVGKLQKSLADLWKRAEAARNAFTRKSSTEETTKPQTVEMSKDKGPKPDDRTVEQTVIETGERAPDASSKKGVPEKGDKKSPEAKENEPKTHADRLEQRWKELGKEYNEAKDQDAKMVAALKSLAVIIEFIKRIFDGTLLQEPAKAEKAKEAQPTAPKGPDAQSAVKSEIEKQEPKTPEEAKKAATEVREKSEKQIEANGKEIESRKKSVEGLKKENDTLIDKQGDLKKQVNNLQGKDDPESNRLRSEAETELKRVTDLIEINSRTIKEHTDKITALEKQNAELKDKVDAAKKIESDLAAALPRLEKMIADLQKMIAELGGKKATITIDLSSLTIPGLLVKGAEELIKFLTKNGAQAKEGGARLDATTKPPSEMAKEPKAEEKPEENIAKGTAAENAEQSPEDRLQELNGLVDEIRGKFEGGLTVEADPNADQDIRPLLDRVNALSAGLEVGQLQGVASGQQAYERANYGDQWQLSFNEADRFTLEQVKTEKKEEEKKEKTEEKAEEPPKAEEKAAEEKPEAKEPAKEKANEQIEAIDAHVSRLNDVLGEVKGEIAELHDKSRATNVLTHARFERRGETIKFVVDAEGAQAMQKVLDDLGYKQAAGGTLERTTPSRGHQVVESTRNAEGKAVQFALELKDAFGPGKEDLGAEVDRVENNLRVWGTTLSKAGPNGNLSDTERSTRVEGNTINDAGIPEKKVNRQAGATMSPEVSQVNGELQQLLGSMAPEMRDTTVGRLLTNMTVNQNLNTGNTVFIVNNQALQELDYIQSRLGGDLGVALARDGAGNYYFEAPPAVAIQKIQWLGALLKKPA